MRTSKYIIWDEESVTIIIQFKINDIVAVRSTKQCSGFKLKPKYLNHYKVKKVKINARLKYKNTKLQKTDWLRIVVQSTGNCVLIHLKITYRNREFSSYRQHSDNTTITWVRMRKSNFDTSFISEGTSKRICEIW